MASNGQNNSKNQVVIVVVPFPAQGHLNQLLHFSRLILSHNIPVHYVGTSIHNRQATTRVQGWDPNSISNIHFHHFKAPPFVSPPPNPNTENKFPSHMVPSFVASSHLREPVAELMHSLSSVFEKVVVIHDSLMASVVQDAKNIANVENYSFLSTCAFSIFTSIWEKVGKPPFESSHIIDVPSMEGCFTTEIYDFINAQSEFYEFSDGSIYNTSRVIESPYLELIERITCSKKHWAVGPFNPLTIEKKKDSKGRHLCMEWLDKQEPNSVIYVSFGTTTTLTDEEIEQIATGLEQSKIKFIWVLRDADKGDIFDGNEGKRGELAKGFEERVEGMGFVVRDWAPQLEILSHPSTGGFMSHCGWNSTLESISMGVPIAAWPMHSDQPRNCVFITQVLKIGLVVMDWAKRHELVTASDIENVVRTLMDTMEGDEMRERAMKLKNAIGMSMDEGGVSRMEMDSFIAHITR
ncbi:putative trans-zeatin O-beta-D-glucosyltransferase [Medicago truncatula]|uniref:Glycosyltransferase n=1 Tax=Medicago truncatula TaxID=3880 RepID=A0A072UFW6_MEDTR|nr:zeatin O-glucosyltransferase [Medicago truncatula]KEH28644.1 zeatin O-glucosyltransferase-like protein [Medicago truncatula]RHN79089.1 putative trans-zeatin O-beta-D-glucosyltransferase [Medicago truncatula]